MPSETQSEYFSSYEDLEVHKLMLEDFSRTECYKKAILSNAAFFKDKVVLDVGCGTGILSIFCAQAGAKKVFAIEASDLANLAQDVVKENNFEDTIQVIQSRVEDVTLPENTQVDIIVSEWMGFYLLHEGMLDSVLVARNKFLKEDGYMFPESAAIYIAPCSVPNLYDKWENVHGVSMSTFAKHLRQSKMSKPEVTIIGADDLLGPEEAIAWINLKEDQISDIDGYNIKHVVGARKDGNYDGLCIWFDCVFPNLSETEAQVTLSTSPSSLPTHWKQTVILLPERMPVTKGEPIAFQLDMKRDESNSRRYNLQLTMLDPEEVEHPLPCSCEMTKCIIIKRFMIDHPEQNGEVKLTNGHGPSNGILVDEEINDEDISSDEDM